MYDIYRFKQQIIIALEVCLFHSHLDLRFDFATTPRVLPEYRKMFSKIKDVSLTSKFEGFSGTPRTQQEGFHLQ